MKARAGLLIAAALCLALGLMPITGPAQVAGPAASWDLSAATGALAADATGKGNDLQLTGVRPEQFMGRSFLRFGSRRYAQGPALGDGWQSLTLVAVVLQESDTGAYAGIICRDNYGGATGDVYGILTDPQGRWAGRLTTAAGQAGLSAPIRTGWHQLALTWDGTTARL